LIILFVVIFAWAYSRQKKNRQAYQEALEKTDEKARDFERYLEQKGFMINKKTESGTIKLYVDDVHKQWALLTGPDSLTKIYAYKDLIDFEIVENKFDEISGGSNDTSNYSVNICSQMDIRIHINDLIDPERKIVIINSNVDTTSAQYRSAMDIAHRFSSDLAYIKNNKPS
jgi:hypothetical protein